MRSSLDRWRVAALLALIAAAPSCGGDDEPAPDTTAPGTAAPETAATEESGDSTTPDAAPNGSAGGSAGSEPSDSPGPEAADPIDEERATVRRFIEIAREGALAKRPQAAQRLGGMGEIAIEELRALLAENELEDLGLELLRAYAELGVEPGAQDLRDVLWEAVSDPDFPYRPAATMNLAATARADEWTAFEPLLGDPLSEVRAAALGAIGTLDDRELEQKLDAALLDENDAVRRVAADLLVTWGHEDALRWLYEDLFRSDRFFELETGKNARYESARVLRRLLSDRALFGYQPREEPSSEANVNALAELGAAIEARIGDGGRRPPAFALRSDAQIGGVLGLEVRSCRRGEFFVAISDDDRLTVGTAHPVEYALAPGTSEAVAALVAERFENEAATLWGEPGCDLECYRLVAAGDAAPRVLRVMKGPEKVEDLRPDPLDAVADALLSALPSGIELAEGGADLAQRLGAALDSVGGATR